MDESDLQYPWIFHRDEIDLLEDQIEDLYERHNHSLGKENTMEQEVLSEQLKTEELFDDNLKDALEHSFFESESFSKEISSFQRIDENSSESSISFRRQAFHQPLYIHARKWAVSVYKFSRTRYEIDKVQTREMFRVYANVNLVPIKIVIGITEEFRDDVLGREIALQEYYLACTYLQRVIESLTQILIQDLESQSVVEMIVIARQLRGGLDHKISQLRRRHQGPSSHYE